METVAWILVFNAIFYLANSSHLHSRLNFQKKGIKYSEDVSGCDRCDNKVGNDLNYNKTVKNVKRGRFPNFPNGGNIQEQMQWAIVECGIIGNNMIKKKTGLNVADQLVKANDKASSFTLNTKKNSKRAGRALGAAEGAATGLVTLVQGIQSGSWQDVVSGGLAIAASIAAFLGPVGVLFSVGLSILSAIFGIFGGATGGEESTEDMTKRILDEALLEQKAEDLRAEASGLRRLYGSLSKTTANLRKADNVTKGQAVEFYNQAFVGVKMFGILEFYIDKWCNINDYKPEDKEDINKNANRCLEFINLYCDLALLRQLLVSDMASFMVEKGLCNTARNLLGLVAEEQRSDMQFLRIIFDPIDHRSQRYVTAKYVSAMEKYTTLVDYLQKLDDISIMETEEDVEDDQSGEQETEVDEESGQEGEVVDGENELALQPTTSRKLLKEFVMYCTGTILQKDCYENSGLGLFDRTKKEFKKMEKKIKSLYITANRRVRIIAPQDTETSVVFNGPGVYSMLHGAEVKTLEIFTHEQTKEVKVCEKENMEIDGECTAFPIGIIADLEEKPVYTTQNARYQCVFPFHYLSEEFNYGCLIDGVGDDRAWCPNSVDRNGHKYGENWGWCKDYSSLAQLKNWKRRIVSLSIPAMLEITGKDTAGKEFGPYYGPSVIYKLPNPRTWDSLEIKQSDHETQKMVKVCSEENLGGFCDHFIPPRHEIHEIATLGLEGLEAELERSYRLNDFHGSDWTKSDLKPRSMKVPGGFRVYLSNTAYGTFGPYEGPVTVTKVDGNDGNSILSNIKIERVVEEIELE